MSKRLLYFFSFLSLSATAQTFTLSTIAGTGKCCYYGNGDSATSAQFNDPTGLAADDSGNVYIVDNGNEIVRKISKTGIITTVAGTQGVSGYSGNGGPATTAKLYSPSSVALDKKGNIYIVDGGNMVIRIINSAGIISNFAGNGANGFSGDGGAATLAKLSYPGGIAIDTSGNVYIGDAGNSRIRKVDNTGKITTIAGNGTAGFSGNGGLATAAELSSPESIALDDTGNIYFVDYGNIRIRKINKSGIISTIAGNGVNGASADGGPATSASLDYTSNVAVNDSGYVFITDNGSNRVRKINKNGTISTIAGTGVAGYAGNNHHADSAELGNPDAITFDQSGNLYIAEAGNEMIRKVNTNDIITTIAGIGVTNFAGDGRQAILAEFNAPQGVGADNIGNVFIADSKNNRIRKINTSGIITTIAGTGVAGYSGDGGPATSAKLSNPVAVAIDDSGNVFIDDNGNGRIRKINTKGIITLIAGDGGSSGHSTGDGGPATAAEIDGNTGICVDDSGNVYITSPSSNSDLRKINTKGIISTLYSGSTTSWPYGVTVDQNFNLYFADYSADNIREINNKGALSTIAGIFGGGYSGDGGPATSAKLGAVTDVSADNNGNLYIADNSNGVIRMINSEGIISTIAGTSSHFSNAMGVAAGTLGSVYIADRDNNRICKLTMDAPLAYFKTIPSTTCSGDSIKFTDSSTYTPTSWKWTFTGGNPSSSTLQNPKVLYTISGSYSVKLVASNLAGSDSTTTIFNLTVNQPPVMGIRPASPLICHGSKVTLYDSLSGATTYTWAPSTGLNKTTGSSVIANPVNTTTYTITGTNTGCTSSIETTLVTVNPLPIVTLSNHNSICSGVSDTLTANGGSNYLWNTGQTTSSIIITPSSNITYTVTVSNGTCSKDTTIGITVNSTPTINISAANSICQGIPDTLTATGGTSYSWNTGQTTSSIIVTPSSSITYTVTVSNGTCSKDTTIDITINSNPTVSIGATNKICQGISDTLTANGGSSYSWNTGQTNSSIIVAPSSSTTYTIAISNGTCSKDTTISITVNSNPAVSINGDIYHTCGSVDTLAAVATGNAPFIYNWSTGATTDSIGVLLNTTYSLTVTDINGCTNASSVTIKDSIPVVPICLVTVDSTSSFIIIIWNDPGTNTGVDSLFLERDSVTVNPIARFACNSYSEFVDTTNSINPNLHSYQYNLIGQDSCGMNSGALTGYAKTIHLTATPVGCNYNLNWTKYYGYFSFTQYYIYRDSASTSWKLIDSVSSGTLTWNDATCYPAGDNISYYIKVEDPNPCTPSGHRKYTNITGSSSNLAKSSIITGIKPIIPSNTISVYPNPFRNTTSIAFNSDGQHYLEVDDMTGRKLETIQCNGTQYELSRNGLAEGIYFIKAFDAENKYMTTIKVVVQ